MTVRSMSVPANAPPARLRDNAAQIASLGGESVGYQRAVIPVAPGPSA
jgi:hypothetical protein